MLIKGDDGEMIECEVISTTEKESSFQKAVPVMNPSLASLFCFLNLVPGNDFLNILCFLFFYLICLTFPNKVTQEVRKYLFLIIG